MAWVKPTGHNDPGSQWTNEANAYDGNTATYALSSDIPAYTWTSFLELNRASTSCSKIRFNAWYCSNWVEIIDIDAYYDGAWHDLYQGSFPYKEWLEKSFSSIKSITSVRFRFYGIDITEQPNTAALYEVEFYEVSLATVTTQAVTNILSITATGNGNITDTGGENATRRGFCYMVGTSGDPTTANSVVYDDGSFGTGAYTKGLTGLSPGTTYRVRAYAVNSAGVGYGTTVQFTTDKVAPTVTTQNVTDKLPTSVTANGTITALGGENATTRGFKYDLTKNEINPLDQHDDGSFGLGAFTEPLTGLMANTTYWIRAYAINSIGTSYGEWIEFQTAAGGTIPTGTDLFIAADLSGYTCQLMKSETDDGYPYTAYFVISTDLANKQALAYYKRILDLWLYFRSESSGTALIEVKRDNEAEWQTVGTVSLTGTADIVIPHLAPDIRGKHFLFKISAQNFFRCLGILFEFLGEDLR